MVYKLAFVSLAFFDIWDGKLKYEKKWNLYQMCNVSFIPRKAAFHGSELYAIYGFDLQVEEAAGRKRVVFQKQVVMTETEDHRRLWYVPVQVTRRDSCKLLARPSVWPRSGNNATMALLLMELCAFRPCFIWVLESSVDPMNPPHTYRYTRVAVLKYCPCGYMWVYVHGGLDWRSLYAIAASGSVHETRARDISLDFFWNTSLENDDSRWLLNFGWEPLGFWFRLSCSECEKKRIFMVNF